MGAWSFSYDYLNRLAAATQTPASGAAQSFCWTYDSFGNRTTQATSNQPFTNAAGAAACQVATSASLLTNTWANYSTANNNQIASAGQGSYGYDPSGGVINDGLNQYLYDAEGRICAVYSSPVAGISTMTGYLYDAGGQRVGKGSIATWSCDPTISGFTPTNDYVLGLSGEQVTEMGMDSNNTLAWQHTNVYGAGTLLATYDQDGLHFYLNDPLGTRRAQTDYEGVLEQNCSSLPFGDTLACTGSTQYPTEHHFTGKERDTESGNDYFGARYYASSMGRFMSPDPSQLYYADPTNPQSLNLYSYALNNPLRFVDPNGLYCAWEDGTSDDDPSDAGIDNNPTNGCEAQGGHWTPDSNPCQGAAGCTATFDWSQPQPADDDSQSGNLPSSDLSSLPGSDLPSSFPDPTGCLAANIAAVNSASNLNVSGSNVASAPYIYNGGLDVNFSVPGASQSSLPAVRYPSSTFNAVTGIGPSLHVPPFGGSDPSTYGGGGNNGDFTFTTHIDSAYATWHTPIGALIHLFVDVRNHGAHRKPC